MHSFRSLCLVGSFLAAALPLQGLRCGVSSGDELEGGMSIAGWGTIVDPDSDCEIRGMMDVLSVVVPATNHNLNPSRGLNAPRVLQKATGDFSVQVKVTADFKPGGGSTFVGGRPFNGAGLLLWAGEKNFLRLERNAYWAGERLICYGPLIEYWREGEFAGGNRDPVAADYFQGRSTWLRLARKGSDVSLSISHDGEEWNEVRSVAVEMPREVFVGVAAINQADEPFKVEFADFKLVAKSDEELP